MTGAVGLAAYRRERIQVFEIIGTSALDAGAHLTERRLTVATLLSPLAKEEVGFVRCLGLNYADHAVRCAQAWPKHLLPNARVNSHDNG